MKHHALAMQVLLVVLAAPFLAAQSKTVIPELRALAGAAGSSSTANATIQRVPDAKGKAALKIQSNAEDVVIVIDKIVLSHGVIELPEIPLSDFLQETLHLTVEDHNIKLGGVGSDLWHSNQ